MTDKWFCMSSEVDLVQWDVLSLGIEAPGLCLHGCAKGKTCNENHIPDPKAFVFVVVVEDELHVTWAETEDKDCNTRLQTMPCLLSTCP